MQSPAPLFSRALFRKNMHRFWPIFAAYIAILFTISLSMVINSKFGIFAGTPDAFIDILFDISGFFSPLIALFTIIVAAAVFSYMYNPMSAAMVNALPFKRSTVFFSNYLSGLFIIMVPLLLFFLSIVGIGISYECLSMAALLKWLFIFVSLSLLLYSVAVILGMLTGSIIAHIVFFVIANFFLIGIETLIETFLQQFLYGFAGTLYGTGMLFMKATPIAYACTIHNNNFNVEWSVWIVYLLLGGLFAWLSYKMYEKRKMENAGDVIAIRQLNPMFKYGVTFCSSLALGSLLMAIFYVNSQSFVLAVIFLLLTGLIGYFAAEMLLRKSFRVLGTYKGFIIYACLLVIASMSVHYDWYGYATRFPDVDKVQAVSFSYSGVRYDAHRILQAEKSNVYLRDIPNLPEPLLLAYGTPVSMEKDPDTDNYVYSDTSNLTSEQTRLLWSVLPGIYCEDESIDNILKLHQYLVDNVKTVRNDYRMLSSNNGFENENIQRFDINLIYRLDNGKLQKYSFPVILPLKPSAEVHQKILTGLASIAGSQEERAKNIAAIDLPLDNIRRITVDMHTLRYLKDEVLSRDSARTVTKPMETDFASTEIRSEDKEALIQAAKADYQNIRNEEIIRQKTCGTLEVACDNKNLPYTNRFRDREFRYDINVYDEQTLSFLYNKGYITDDMYEVIQKYRELLDARYTN